MPMDRCMTLINTNIFLCSVSLGHNLESKSWFLNSFSSQRTRASYWQTLGLRVEIRKTNTEYSVMPERRIFFYFFCNEKVVYDVREINSTLQRKR